GESVAQFRKTPLVADHGQLRIELSRQSGEFGGLAIGGQRQDAPFPLLPPDEVQRGTADRTRRAEDGERSCHQKLPIPSKPTISATGMIPSTRSNTPPCPGIRRELSFTCAFRLSQLSKKSPACA